MRRVTIAWLAVCIVVFTAAYFKTQSLRVLPIAAGFYLLALWYLYVDRCEAHRSTNHRSR